MNAHNTSTSARPAGAPGHMLIDVPLYTGLTPAVAAGEPLKLLLGWGSLVVLAALGVAVRVGGGRDAKTPVPEGTGVAG